MLGTKLFGQTVHCIAGRLSTIRRTQNLTFRTSHEIIRMLMCENKGFVPRTFKMNIHTTPRFAEEKITIHFINRKGENTVVKAAPDDTLLDVAVDNDLDIESFGVCEGTLGCSTCHVILEERIFNLLEKTCPPTAEEMDMLDLACGLTETSRLGCQVEISKDLEGCTVRVPKEAIDARDL